LMPDDSWYVARPASPAANVSPANTAKRSAVHHALLLTGDATALSMAARPGVE
jgi:hypothetical protein